MTCYYNGQWLVKQSVRLWIGYYVSDILAMGIKNGANAYFSVQSKIFSRFNMKNSEFEKSIKMTVFNWWKYYDKLKISELFLSTVNPEPSSTF